MKRFNFKRLTQRRRDDVQDVEPKWEAVNTGESATPDVAATSDVARPAKRARFKGFLKGKKAKTAREPKAKTSKTSKAPKVPNRLRVVAQDLSQRLLKKQTLPAPVVRLDAADLLIVTDHGEQRAWWKVDLQKDAIEEIAPAKTDDDYIGEFDPAPLAVPVLSFSVQDFTASINKKDRKGQITAKFERNEGLKVEILPRAQQDKVAFGAPGAWISNFAPQRLFPGTYALHLLLRDKRPVRFPAVVGFILQQAAAPLLVLYRLDQLGQLSDMAYVPRAGGKEEIALALRSFADDKAIQLSDNWMTEQLVLFTATDLAGVLGRLKSYPTEAAIANVPIRHLWNIGLGVAAVGCAASVAWVGVQQYELSAMQSQLETATTRLDQTRLDIEHLAQNRFTQFVSLANVDPIPALLAAQSVYTDGAKVALLVRRGVGAELTVSAPMAADAAQRLKAAPAGCRREPLTTSSNANTIQATYECTPPGFDFSSLFGIRDAVRGRAWR